MSKIITFDQVYDRYKWRIGKASMGVMAGYP